MMFFCPQNLHFSDTFCIFVLDLGSHQPLTLHSWVRTEDLSVSQEGLLQVQIL